MHFGECVLWYVAMILWFWGRWGDLWICTDVFSTKILNVTIIVICCCGVVYMDFRKNIALDNYILHARGVQQKNYLRRLVCGCLGIHTSYIYIIIYALVDKVFLPPIINFIWYSRELTPKFSPLTWTKNCWWIGPRCCRQPFGCVKPNMNRNVQHLCLMQDVFWNHQQNVTWKQCQCTLR